MSHYRRHSLEPSIDSITNRFRDSLNFQRDDDDVINKPDFRELDYPLKPRVSSSAAATPAASGSSSSSSGSASGKPSVTSQLAKRSHSGELSESGSGTPGSGAQNRTPKPGHRRSASAGTPLIYSGLAFSPVKNRGGGSGATSPSPGVVPSGNICPSGKIPKTGMASRASVKPETLFTGNGNYGHGNIVRGGGGKAKPETRDPEEVKKAGNDMYRKGNFSEALSLYDKAISMSPENPAYRSNRAAALAASGRLKEAVKECLEAVRLDPSYVRAHQRLASLYLRYDSHNFTTVLVIDRQ